MNYERLLNVAKALRESPNPGKFTMVSELHSDCGTPACAWGHYAARSDLQSLWTVGHPLNDDSDPDEPELCSWFGVLYADGSDASYDDDEVREHFDIDDHQHDELFSPDGCGGAKTALEAAEFIEAFVARHKEAQP